MKLLGKDPDGLIGKVLWDEFSHVPNEEAMRRVMSERVPISDELYYAPLGEYVENHMYPSPDGGVVSFQRYVTERRRVQEELQKAQAELAHVARVMSMGELAASIAHEINQPLGAIANNASACSRLLSGAPQEARNALRDIVQDANRASAIIARVRSLTKGSIPEKVSVDVKDIIGDVLALTQRQLSEREITVQTEFAQGLPLVLGDRIELQQVFLNLIMNAMEAMEGLGADRRSMIVAARHHELERSPGVLVSIQDGGIGFNPRTAEHLFEPFFTTKPGGLGMGLRISRSIIEAHGGRIWATANALTGATFSFALPVGGA
jgi:C4-dicarboxylate-specific signal transduction histidine kinase